MGKCCSKPQKDEHFEEEFQEVLLDVDPGGGSTDQSDPNMSGGTLVVRSPGRWQVTTTREIPVNTTTKITRAKTGSPKTNASSPKTSSPGTRITTNGSPKNGVGTVTKTFRITNNGSPTKMVVTTSDQGPGGVKGKVTKISPNGTKTNGTGRSPLLKQKGPPTGRIVTPGINNKSKAVFKITPNRMGKTTTETATRVYTKDGKRYKETVVTETVEDERGNTTKTTKTTTEELDPYDTKEMTKAIDDTKTKSPKGRNRKSSSSSDSSLDRSGTKKKGLVGKLKSKVGSHHKESTDSGHSSDEEDFIKDVYKGINQKRKQHGVGNLTLSKELNQYAKEWAKKLAADGQLSHRPDNKYGENVYCVSSNSPAIKITGDEVVDKWYSEMNNHVFGEEPKGKLLKSGHLTQMLWKDTKKVGVAKARSPAGTKIFVVANFDPQGNWMGQFATQVPPVGGFQKTSSGGKTFGKVKSRKSSSSSSSSSDEGEGFAEDCLKAHNVYRKKHGVQTLKISKKLNNFAQEWAEKIAKKDMMQHRQPNEYGENIYCAWSSNPKYMIKAQEAVDSWYEEIKDFTFGREPRDLSAGHFTQVIWKESKELGVGIARSSSGKLYVVANYSPAGNMVGSFAKNVPRAV